MITEVKQSTSGKWPQIVLSRTSDEFLLRLFEIEVPEIAEGIVEIVGVARDPGIRAKIGVRSLDKNVDPVGACVGMRGSRIQSIVRELRGEKIDIIEWSENPATYISRAITPAKVESAYINQQEQSIDVIVADDQLALAIGKRGQNAKLAVKLTQWRINITSESERRAAVQESFEQAIAEAGLGDVAPVENQVDELVLPAEEEQEIPRSELLTLEGVGEKMAEQLYQHGFSFIEDIASSSIEELSSIPGIGPKTAKKMLKTAQEHIDSWEDETIYAENQDLDPQISEVVEDEE
jgi:N utilization substance protein A